ncbi:MAG: hypothetical protein CBC34_018765 [Hyphomicrobiaceae bacterium TMED74]|jgi:hypothetical protein|nr:hypothetical protein [Filomicrobium sp.]RPG36962.1 MAG: hypothetical protein CBC34_018765 [Hyphomicrobiaceae bacterium TMED74]
MSSHNERNEALALINMFTYLERELRVSLEDEHLASLTRTIADELKRRYAASPEEAFQLLEIEPRISPEPQ